jgi:large subunit ribosomal protein L13
MPAKKKLEKKESEKKRYLFDCHDFVLGRLASKAAFILMGKHKADYTPYEDRGDCVVVVNSQDIRVTGRKRMNKIYHRFSGYPGGISSKRLDDVLKINPSRAIQEAIYGMLPKNKLRDRMMKRVKILSDENHGLKEELIKVK